jgi:rubrerythrin
VRGDETAAEITQLARGMERALQLFYETVQGRTQDLELKELLLQLAHVEEIHGQKLLEVYQRLKATEKGLVDLPAAAATDLLEGGFKVKEFMTSNEAYLDTVPHVLDLAMMLETQALDLYLRFADRCDQMAAKSVLFAIADEEKVHLTRLGQLLEAKLRAKG